jgi:hypothetical protein
VLEAGLILYDGMVSSFFLVKGVMDWQRDCSGPDFFNIRQYIDYPLTCILSMDEYSYTPCKR